LLPDAHRSFLISQIQALSEGPEGGAVGATRLVRAVRNKFGVSDEKAKEAIAWVEG
jgi:hypothetical protein